MTKFVWLDNAGENKLFEQSKKSKDWQLGVQMEYTPRDTPRHNHLAELAFAVIGNKGRSILVLTRYGQSSRLPSRYREEMNAVVITDWPQKIITKCSTKKKKMKKTWHN